MKAGEFWDQTPSTATWTEHLVVRHYVNESISGYLGTWPVEWFERTFPGIHFPLVLTVGCGTGALDRQLVERGIADRVEAFDGSVYSLYRARLEAERVGMSNRIHYFAWDFDEPYLKLDRYDAVFFSHSLHHVAKLEKLLRAVMHALKQRGIVYLDELVGPSRTYWNDRTIAPYRDFYDSIPSQYRIVEQLPYPIQPGDPSEAIRSGEIRKQLDIGFDVIRFRGYGGNLLAMVFPFLDSNALTDNFVQHLVTCEKKLLREGVPPFYAVIVARPRKGWRRHVASYRYFLEPKIKRIGRELRTLGTLVARHLL